MTDVENKESEMNTISIDDYSELHLQLQDQLAAYADNELDDQQRTIIKAHLAGCTNCRNDVARQQLLNQRLQNIPVTRVSVKLNQKLDEMLIKARNKPKNKMPSWQLRQFIPQLSPLMVSLGGWTIALLLSLFILFPNANKTLSNIPMINDVVNEYENIALNNLPRVTNVSNVSAPAQFPNGRLLATWKTTVGGANAQAFAVRIGNKLIIQYQISEQVFFRNPDVRQAIATMGELRTHANNLDILAIPMKNSGLLIVGPADTIPERNEIQIRL